MKKYIYSFIVACMALFAITSCSDVDIPEGIRPPKAENLTSQVDGRTVTLNLTLPTDENKSGVEVIVTMLSWRVWDWSTLRCWSCSQVNLRLIQ